MAEEPKKKKRNPQDSTLRNVRATARRISLLETAITELAKEVSAGSEIVMALRERVETLKKVAHIAPRT